jgi:glycerophosphoryl diester phosphodiesterase
MTMIRTDNERQIDSVFMVSKTEAIHIDPSHNTPTAVQKIKGNGARIWINALGITDNLLAKGNVAELEKLLSSGANMIQTDQPELLLKYLREHNLHQ